MQIHHRSRLATGGIELALTAENPDDIWCIYNLLSEGDEIVVFTSRKVKKESPLVASVKQEVKKFNIKLLIERITYASSQDDLQVSGKNIADNPFVKIGQYHTAEIRLHSKITLKKAIWNSYYNEKLNEVTNVTNQAEQTFLVVDSGKASLYFILRYLTKEAFSLTYNIPNRKISNLRFSHHQKAIENFYKAIIKKLCEAVNFDVTRTIVITGPGFTKTSFYNYIKENSSKLGYEVMNKNLKSFILCDSTSSDRRAIGEVLRNKAFVSRIHDQHYIHHNRAIDTLRKRLEDNDETVAIGLEDVCKAVQLGAVDSILITEYLIRNGYTEQRKHIHHILEDAKRHGGKVYYLSDEHYSSEFLTNLTGVAALLRMSIEGIS